jgi:hypothetical protein
MDIESLGFLVGVIGAVLMKASMGEMKTSPAQTELDRSLGHEPANNALKSFLRGLVLVLAGLGLETYARLFSN